MDNLHIYNAVRQPPAGALRAIQAGRLRGKTDINPMWRLKALTEQFGPCGIGWKYVITRQWLEVGANDEVAAFVNIDLFIKAGGSWSEAIPGTGGSSFVTKEKGGLYTSDECYKMALTDAISVACKALGFAADIYWDNDTTKYDRGEQVPTQRHQRQSPPKREDKPSGAGEGFISVPRAKRMFALARGNADIVRQVLAEYNIEGSNQVPNRLYDEICDKVRMLAIEQEVSQ